MELSAREHALLQSHRLFSCLIGDVAAASLAGRRDWLASCRRGQTLVPRGGRPGHAVLVLEGVLEVVLANRSGSEKALRILRAGDCCGLENLFSGMPAASEVRALTPARCLRLPGEVLASWLASSPAFRAAVMRQIADDTAHLYEEMEGIHHQGADRRLACYLHCGERRRRATGEGERPVAGLSYGKLARRLGTSQPHLSRTLRDLEAAGAIGRSGRELRVLDPAVFARLLCTTCQRPRHPLS